MHNKQRSQIAEAAFHARLGELGATVLGNYVDSGTPVVARCAAGHDCKPRPGDVQRGRGICRTCAGNDPVTAEAAFRATLDELGATLMEPEWLGSNHPHYVRCSEGHDCYPSPTRVQQGQGICRPCANNNLARKAESLAAEAAFRTTLDELGAEMLGTYKNNKTRILVRCVAGHECRPQPGLVRRGQGICGTCAGNNPAAAEATFRARMAEMGAAILGDYTGNRTRIPARCAAGHDCMALPASVNKGLGICRTCAGNDPVTAEAAFRARLIELGATPLYTKWLGKDRKHAVRCVKGHDCTPRPGCVQQGQGICKTCADQNRPRTAESVVAEAAFHSRLAELGATPLYTEWMGALKKHHVRCAGGHDCWPRPNNVQQGGGICWTCTGVVWDVFYVVANPDAGHLKFGISSGDPRPRLSVHRSSGYRTVIRLLTGLPGTTAPDIETAVLATLRLSDSKPIRGREYYDVSVESIVLDIVDNYPVPELNTLAVRANSRHGKVNLMAPMRKTISRLPHG